MNLSHFKLRQLFAEFWEKNNHKLVPPISLIPQNDPTTLFTSAGMQPLVPYLLGENHPLGKRLYNIQRCFRSQDIEFVGDNRHTTFFEMMGNWSLGDYFKQEQLSWFFEFLVEKIKLNPEKLYVSVFIGENNLPKDTESIKIWQKIFKSYKINAQLNERIFAYSSEKNWWSRAGVPKDMPPGEPGGPDSEVFFDFGYPIHKNCHPNCECGRFLEIGNSVFMEYKKNPDGSFSPLPKKNVDFGGGLERILAVLNNNPDLFMSELYLPIIEEIEKTTGKKYQDKKNSPIIRVIADHLKAAIFLINDGVVPGNKEQGYVLRRLIRRTTLKLKHLTGDDKKINLINNLVNKVIKIYGEIYFSKEKNYQFITEIIENEMLKFGQTLKRGLSQIERLKKIDGKIAFDLYQSYGFPLELTEEILREKGVVVDKQQFAREFAKHKELSRVGSIKKFQGGLANKSQQTIKYHTATHLLHQALYDILGNSVRQEGSNITDERLRFDFFSLKKPTDIDIKQVEKIVNQKINEGLIVNFQLIDKEIALKSGAKAFFKEKYPQLVKVYSIGNYSKEICGGPHVKNTREIGKISIYKLEKIGSNLYRLYAK
ncbi:MAG: alanine--tRNA ligase [Microgenomates group bacterium]|nr:alanine--tRNA ligase [Microgenomates group bacterium]